MIRRLHTMMILAAAALSAAADAAHANDPIWSRDRAFRIPFEVDPADRSRLQEIQLHVSTDRGRTWRQYSQSRPEEADFDFTARSDGEYWFTVRTVDRQGRKYPPTLNGVAPQLRVILDTTAPEISLKAFNPVGERIGVSWEIVEENLDLETLRLEFRTQGSRDWHPVRINRSQRGEAAWELGVPGAVDIRLRVLDYAQNEGIRTINLGAPGGIPAVPAVSGSDGSMEVPASPSKEFEVPSRPRLDRAEREGASDSRDFPPSTYGEPRQLEPIQPYESRPHDDQPAFPQRRQSGFNQSEDRAPLGQGAANVRLVNSKVFGINYVIEEQGKSGLGSVDLYYTYDGRTWSHYGADEDLTSPFVVEVNEEGVYGFTLVVKNGAGIGDDPPRSGDPPQAWVEVDLTPPEIELDPPQPGTGTNEGLLSISWYVRDKNLAQRPISLSYSEKPSGPWTTIREEIENSGRFQWRMPEETPFKFFLRIEARDKADNVGSRVTDRPVIVDLARPRPRIIGVEPTELP